MGLAEYKAKRDFKRTAEPPGRVKTSASSRRAKALRFVVQKHDATRLHYDFRLEMEGVLKSWAVPKGFPTSKGDRRLAVEVEDHPLDYAGFEGTIPQGNYGAGTVMVWDHGTYEVSGDDPLGALKAGKLHLFLSGKKLNDEWTLVRMRPRPGSDKPEWLLLKSGESVPPFSPEAEHRSAVSGRTLQEIAGEADRKEWQSNRPDAHVGSNTWKERIAAAARQARAQVQDSTATTAKPKRATRSAKRSADVPPSSSKRTQEGAQGQGEPEELARAPKAAPNFLEPMKALLTDKLPTGDNWIFEVKFDGVRALAIKDGQTVELVSRSGNQLTEKFSAIAAALRKLPAKQAVLDGELVAVDDQGRSSFQLLQSYHASHQKAPLLYYVFDILNYEGRDVRGLPLLPRKALAEKAISGTSDLVRFSPAIRADADRVLKELQMRGLEGLLAKKCDSIYESGRRSGAWLKYKWTREQEFVIGGYTPPQGARTHFGALLVGYYQGSQLHFAGKVGTGFDQKALSSLFNRFERLKAPTCPFVNLPEKRVTHGGGLTASEMRRCTWLEPRLVCQVRFAEWTRDDKLRQPAFLGLREDKKPTEVVRERPMS